ncbi:hypothetical protein M3Y97_01082600 [Aphelenchoides bicaudatus]|nr:hypothetical protein M3Y97_01082600 [Aphelenchoides bicaudatus]
MPCRHRSRSMLIQDCTVQQDENRTQDCMTPLHQFPPPLVPAATSSTNQYSSQPQLQQRSPSPNVDLVELSKLECPETSSPPEKGIKLTSVPLKETSVKYKQLDGNEDKDLVNELEKEVWMKEPEKVIEPEHECKMTEYMRKKIYDSKRQTRRAWQTTHDTLQKLREKELAIRELKLQLGSTRTKLWRSGLLDKQKFKRKQTIHILYSNATSSTNQDFKQIFADAINDSFQKLPSKSVVSSEISKQLDRLEETVESRASDVKIISERSSEQRPHIKINPLRQSIKTFSPLAIVTNKPPSSTPVPGYQSQTVAQYLLGLPPTPLPIDPQTNEDTDVALTPAQLRERQILKLHPPIQYASPAERTRVLNKTLIISKKSDGKDSNETTRITGPTLIRKVIPTITKRIQTSPSTIGTRQNALELQYRPQKSPWSQQASNQSVQTSKQPSPGVAAWRSVVMGRGSNSRDILMRITRDATEQAQQENLRRLEALFPIKQEPEDSS